SITPMILVSGIILDQFHTSYHEKVHDHLEELVRKHKQNIDRFLTEKLGDIRFLTNTFSYGQLCDESLLQERLNDLQKSYNGVFEDLGVVNEQGLQISYAGPFKLVKARYSEAEWFNKAINSQYYISDVFLGLRGMPHFIVSVRHIWDGKPWLLRATIDFMAFNSLVENLRVGKTGFAFILNKEGKFQTKPFSEILPDRGPYTDFIKKGDMKDEIHTGEWTSDSENRNIMYVAGFLKNGDWMLVCQQDERDAFSNLARTQNIAIIIILVGALLIVSIAILLSSRMVSRIAKADREKELLNQQVIETGKLASVGELAAGIAHEINNPVAIMVEEAGWIQDLLEEEELRQSKNLDEFYRALKQIDTQGKRCKEITHKLLSFARKTDSKIHEVQINELIEDVVGLSEQSAKYNKVTISKTLQQGMPSVHLSHTEIQQVLLNLINNALYAMEKQGGNIDIRSQLDHEHIVITLADNGPGIPRANLGRIFDPFFTTKPVGKGTGLGLSICFGIIKKMGGEIDVQSVVDMGTTFHIRIPLETGLSD
ncbi:ATP-binding protein, partial [Desulfobacterales bacterium HSG2]|nr:ATP-binding protein [Desulfobacterales bacterium HSG2]